MFAKIDAEELASVATMVGILAYPTIVFFRDGQEIDRFSGADEGRLRNLCERFASSGCEYDLEKKKKSYVCFCRANHDVCHAKFDGPKRLPVKASSTKFHELKGLFFENLAGL